MFCIAHFGNVQEMSAWTTVCISPDTCLNETEVQVLQVL